ncbi:lactation elevated protein [Sodiomyces alkalinus F11]|uniref:Lactation elevated protein n=1 Tax=Sodiomyces alkalinus (strain CBS 110278 / VKM F-3762 / F11) TaxID=1314773 RepID=A0A3N2PMG8_SODAK|nr:lactation elevated protein [Sodiomyces alkalinus F11]ROT35659.1 lactation elevated protein [Sodiomyces alkalinus F11]
MRRFSTSVTITDPLVKYRSLVATGVYSPDPAQHRLAKHLQDVYQRLKDYTPAREYRERLKEITDLATKAKSADQNSFLAVDTHPIWRNPLFRRLFTAPEGNHTLALTRVLTNHENALEIDSPKGLFLSGEVGTGKSMLIDLLSDGLPTHRKKRWHFNTFMLYTFSQLERFRRAHPEMTAEDGEYSLLWMAKNLVEESPILFLDEFQLPDRVASKIISHLFIAFFQLGGVLVASSNRIPEELQKAIGVEYTPPAAGGFTKNLFSGKKTLKRGELFGTSSDFSAFLEVLKARCDFWHMEDATDWRRVGGSVTPSSHETFSPGNSDDSHSVAVNINTTELEGVSRQIEEDSKVPEQTKRPANYYLPTDHEATWRQLWDIGASGEWSPETLIVYGRKIAIPYQRNGCVYWDFEKLVESSGPADYVTMASTYHTFIVDNVPVLTALKKNEARRFITFLDALYEAKCKLFVRAAREPDGLFFPEMRARPKKAQDGSAPVLDSDVLHSETIAEVYQDSAAPFRPNISLYDTASGTGRYDLDEDSEFGPENIHSTSAYSGARGGEDKKLDFSDTSAFTGEDERFAYKRAASRLWEMCGAKWHARTGKWWQPLPPEARHWERSPALTPLKVILDGVEKSGSDMFLGPSVTLEEPAGLQRLRIKSIEQLEREK